MRSGIVSETHPPEINGVALTVHSLAAGLAALLPGFTALVAASRVILGLHYPSDVLAALVIGSGLGSASMWLLSSLG